MTRLKTIDAHAAGEPLRLIVDGFPSPRGATMLEKREWVKRHADHLRRALMLEPRGHADMYGAILTEPVAPGSHAGVLFMHNEGYSTMCGHATIALGRYAVDAGIVEPEGGAARFNLQCPCGLVRVRVACENGKPGTVGFVSVPAFAFALDREIAIDGLGKLKIDIGYGGAFYAFVPAARFGLDVRRSPVRDLVDAAAGVTQAAKAQIRLEHPDDADLAFLYGTILTDGADAFSPEPTANVCVFAEREVDRSPTGSGVTARIALQHARGLIALGQERRFESLTGAIFTGKALRETLAGRFPAVTVEVGGKAHYTGRATFTLEDDDEIGRGFLLK